MSESDLLYRVDKNTAWITINREDRRNTITSEVTALFMDCLNTAEMDPAVRVVAVTGAGSKVFCAGADLGGAIGTGGNDGFQQYANLLKRLSGFPKPTAARVNGHCLAGGTGFILACDIVIASDEAVFGTPEVNVGLFPMMIGALIFRNAPRKKAMEMALLGDRLTAVQALDMGMVTRIVPSERLDAEVGSVLEKLAAKSPAGMRIGKQAFHAVQDMPFEDALDYLAEKLGDVASTKDALEGVTAFMEKRAPKFTGE